MNDRRKSLSRFDAAISAGDTLLRINDIEREEEEEEDNEDVDIVEIEEEEVVGAAVMFIRIGVASSP
jgi:hypothetical protein